MKHKKLSEAMEHIDSQYIAQAAKPRKRKALKWIAPIAAVLVAAIGLGLLLYPWNKAPEAVTHTVTPSCQLAAPVYPQLLRFDSSDHNAYYDQQRALHEHPEGYDEGLYEYYADFASQVLSSAEGKNIVCSPVNVYMALAMLAEVTGGQSRRQILELLNAESIEALRTQAEHVWKGHYNDDGLTASLLGSSLWLQENYAYKEETVQTLADSYYASVFRGALGTPQMDELLHSWINEQTGDLLKEQAGNLSFDPRTLIALATTIYYRAEWDSEFRESDNQDGTFHAPSGDVDAVYMHKRLNTAGYYRGEHFGAVSLGTKDMGRMWLFLPDEGFTPEQISEEVMAFLASEPSNYDDPWPDQKTINVNLSLPKFDIVSDVDLVDTLRQLGVTDVFTPGAADFSSLLTEDDGGCVNKVQHAARVAVDEKGVTAAAYTVIIYCGAGMMPEEEMDFILDRPFLFVMESREGMPLFTGVVNHP